MSTSRWLLGGLAGAFALVVSACTPVVQPTGAPNAQAHTSVVVTPHFAARRAVWRFEDFDGPGVTWAGATTSAIYPNVVSTTYANVTHVFYGAFSASNIATERLRHAWIDSLGYHYEDLDGPGVAGANGRTAHPISSITSTVVVGSTLHVFYIDQSNSHLRHAWFDGSSWQFEDVPGVTVGGDNTATAVNVGGVLHLYFLGAAGSTLSEMTLASGSWTSAVNLDGVGVTIAHGETNNPVGSFATAVSDGTHIHVFYKSFPSTSTGVLRHAYFDGSTWHFENVNSFAFRPAVALVQGAVVHLFGYDGQFHVVQHAFGSFGSWTNDLIGGFAGGNACTVEGVGGTTAGDAVLTAAIVNGAIDVLYRGSPPDLCLAISGGSGWAITPLEGNGVPVTLGRSSNVDVGALSMTVTGVHVNVFALNGEFGPNVLRHARL